MSLQKFARYIEAKQNTVQDMLDFGYLDAIPPESEMTKENKKFYMNLKYTCQLAKSVRIREFKEKFDALMGVKTEIIKELAEFKYFKNNMLKQQWISDTIAREYVKYLEKQFAEKTKGERYFSMDGTSSLIGKIRHAPQG